MAALPIARCDHRREKHDQSVQGRCTETTTRTRAMSVTRREREGTMIAAAARACTRSAKLHDTPTDRDQLERHAPGRGNSNARADDRNGECDAAE